MATWRNNDREESKPSWLNKAQKRNCVRTVRGWEVPASNTYGNQFDGWKTQGSTAYIPNLELIVALPTDITGGGHLAGSAVGPNFFVRGVSGAYGDGYGGLPTNAGFTAESGRDVPNYTPYFTCPFEGDTCTAGGPNGVGVTHQGTLGTITGASAYAYRTNKYGVSSLGLPWGITAYLKVCVNDFNYTQNLQITSGSYTGFSLYTGSQLLDQALVPTEVYTDFFGPTASVNNNIGVIRFTTDQAKTGHSTSALTNVAGATAGFIVIGLTANDRSGVAVGGLTSGATAGVRFTVRFDRI